MLSGRLTYITCEHIEMLDCGSPKHAEEIRQRFFLPNNHIIAVCDICYSIIIGEVIQNVVNNAVKSAKFLKGQ